MVGHVHRLGGSMMQVRDSASSVRLIGPPMAPPAELLRWLMQQHGIACFFEPRAAGLHVLQQRRLGMPVELPLILTPDGPVGGLRPSLAWLDTLLQQRGENLYPEAGDRLWVEAVIAPLFPAAVQMFYWHMLKAPRAIIPPSVAGVPIGDRLAVQLGFPLWRGLLRRGLKLDEFDPARAEAAIFRQFDEMAEGLAKVNGKAGMDVRDILFAVLASPVLLPPGHPASLPPMESLPGAFRALVVRCRKHPAGQHALETYLGRGVTD